AGDLGERPGQQAGRALDLATQALRRCFDVRERDGHQGKSGRWPRPMRSSRPSWMFMFWIAWPEAPFTRLSSADTTIASPGMRLGWTPIRHRFVPRTWRVARRVLSGRTWTNGSAAR